MKKKSMVGILLVILIALLVAGGLLWMSRNSGSEEASAGAGDDIILAVDSSSVKDSEFVDDLESAAESVSGSSAAEEISAISSSPEELQATSEDKNSGSEETDADASNSADTADAAETAETADTANPESTKGRIAIDPGHQGSWVDMSGQEAIAPGSSETKMKATSGTSGRYTGVPEYQLTLDISLKLRDRLEELGYEVILTREDNDTAISNSERAMLANDAGADFSIRIHADGSEDSSASGATALIPGYDNPYVGNLAAESERLASCVLNAYCASTGMNNRGITYHNDMTGINWSTIPVMILEMGFMTNPNDDVNMQDEAYQEFMVEGIVNGIEQYYGY